MCHKRPSADRVHDNPSSLSLQVAEGYDQLAERAEVRLAGGCSYPFSQELCWVAAMTARQHTCSVFPRDP